MPVLPQAFPRAAVAASADIQQLARSAAEVIRDSTISLFRRAVPLATSSPSSPHLLARQSQPGYILVIPTQYQGLNSGPAPGAVVGIILGSVGAFLFILWLLWILSNGSPLIVGGAYVGEEVEVVSRRSRRSITPPPPKSRRASRAATEKTAARSPRRDRIIRTERIVRERDEYPPSLGSPPPRDRSRIRETIIVEPPTVRRVPGDDIVEVIEEHSDLSLPPPRRARSGRGSVYRSVQQESEFYD
jgi:hypothetical protein